MKDDELEQAMRDGLVRRADGADVSAPVARGVVAGARDHARRRRTTRVGVLAGAAVVVVAAGVGVGVVAGRDDGPVGVATDPIDSEAGPGHWRTEYWHDVAVDVPADWGWGAAPIESRGRFLTCGATGEGNGYVGRPIGSSDVCSSFGGDADVPQPDEPYLWFGVDLAPGFGEFANGYVQQTVQVGDTTVTVATDDEALRERIVDSIRGGEKCLSSIPGSGPIARDLTAPDQPSTPVTMRVCAYRLGEEGIGDWQLTYATDLGHDAIQDYLDAVQIGEPPRDQCPTIDYQLQEAVILEFMDSEGGIVRQDAVNTFGSCAGVAVGAERIWELETTKLTPAMVAPWAVGGIPAVVHGPSGFGLIEPQG